jgi:hypothetical protein
MPQEAPGADADKSATATESEISKLISEEIGKQLNGRLFKGGGLAKAIQEALSASLPQLVEQHLEKVATSAAPAETTETKSANITMRALEDKYKALEAKHQASEKARQDAEAKALDTRLRSDVRAKLATSIDPKYLDMAMDSLFDTRKRFAFDDQGNASVKFQRDGYAELVSLEKGIPELVSGELKHFIPAKNANLPSAAPGLRGYVPPAQTSPQSNPFADEIINHFGRHGSSPFALPGQGNGTQPK